MILLGIFAFSIGACFFVGTALLWYHMAKGEYRKPFHALCPETLEPVDIRIDATHAARTRFQGSEQLVVTACSRWPERAGCDQACTVEVPFLSEESVEREVAVFGSQPGWSKPVEMTPELLARLKAS